MFGIRFIKVEPTDFVLQFKRGQVVREGAGLSFFYYGPTSSLVRVPVGSVDVPFIFEEVTADFQKVTVQGQLTYRVADPRKLAQLMNFTLAPNGRDFSSDDSKKLPQRLINHAQVLTSTSLRSTPLREALGGSDTLVASVRDGLRAAEAISSLGVEVLGLSILAIKPTPETARALEAETRESILRQADEAVFTRRNFAVEQERAIKENELNTEIAVENKKRQIKEAQMDAEKSVAQKKRELREAEMATKIALEQQNKDLLALSTANARDESDAKAYGISAMMKALSQTDPKTLQALTCARLDAAQLVALAFKELAENAEKIGELNISPELLNGLLSRETK
ncbi:SPFH domain-containing protein [Uliginosibacterium flavum]|uniref:SPFH domain-containing protein n=1 Tax=Uliginosibacterium flavum TaxID=1396831 RepID=A0ABV2TH88_9RHOO